MTENLAALPKNLADVHFIGIYACGGWKKRPTILAEARFFEGKPRQKRHFSIKTYQNETQRPGFLVQSQPSVADGMAT